MDCPWICVLIPHQKSDLASGDAFFRNMFKSDRSATEDFHSRFCVMPCVPAAEIGFTSLSLQIQRVLRRKTAITRFRASVRLPRMPHDAFPSQIHNSNYPPQHQPDFSTEPAVSHVLGNEKLDLGDQKAYICILFSLSLVLSSSLFNHEDFNELQIRAYQFRERNTRTELGSTHTYQRGTLPHIRHHAGRFFDQSTPLPVPDRPLRLVDRAGSGIHQRGLSGMLACWAF